MKLEQLSDIFFEDDTIEYITFTPGVKILVKAGENSVAEMVVEEGDKFHPSEVLGWYPDSLNEDTQRPILFVMYK